MIAKVVLLAEAEADAEEGVTVAATGGAPAAIVLSVMAITIGSGALFDHRSCANQPCILSRLSGYREFRHPERSEVEGPVHPGRKFMNRSLHYASLRSG
jgi:hypothetical protein